MITLIKTWGFLSPRRAIESPLRQIVDNAGYEASVIVNKVIEGQDNFGFNAATGEYGDLVEMGHY